MAVSFAVCLAIYWLNRHHEETVHHSRQLLTNFREGRLDLARGFLRLTLADEPQSPFRREEGFALLEQAIAELKEAEGRIISTAAIRPEDGERVQAFAAKADVFRERLVAYQRAEAATKLNLQRPLRLSFHDLDRLAQDVDRVGQYALQAQADQLDTRFAAALSVAMLLLVTTNLALYRVARGQQASDRELRESEERLQTLGDNIPGGALYQLLSPPDGRNRYTYFSAGIERIFGISASSVLADPAPFWELIVEEDRPAIDAAQARSLRDLTVFDCEFRQRTLTGETKWLHAVSKPRRLADGSTIWDGAAMDITRRKQAEAALERTTNTLVEAQQIAHVGSFEYIAATQTTMWSDEEYRIYGLDPTGPSPKYDEMLARCIHPDDAALLHETFVKAIQSHSVYELEHRIVWPDGSVRWVHDRARPYLDPRGNLVRYVGITLDITERKQSEQALRESEARRSLALDAAQAGTWEWDLTTGRNTWSDELWKLYGLELRSCQPSYEAWRESVHPEDRERVEQELQAIVHQEAELNLEWRVSSSSESPRWLMSRGRPLRDASGRVIRYLGVVMDITDRKRLEASLRESEARAIAMLNAIPDMMFRLDRHGIFLDYKADIRDLHRQVSFLIGQRNRDVTPPEFADLVERKIGETLAAGQVQSFEYQLPVPGAGVQDFEARMAPCGQDEVLAIVRNITERKRLEQDRAAMEARLLQQQKLESIGTLASGVAHEINNPITGILNYAQLIQDELPGDSPLAEFTGEIMHETQRVATIVRSLLTFARHEKQSHSPARMADIVEAVLALVRTLIRRDEITLRVTVPPDLPKLKCRSQQIQQVIMNLVTNARDALNERYPGYHADKVLSLEATLLERAGRRWIRLTVEDRGTGIPPEVRERMFDPFFTTKGRDKGTGLGLSISHGIIKDHHGEWTVESEPGQFTRINVDLPVDNGWEI